MAEGAIPVCTGTFPTDTWDYKGLVQATKILEDKSLFEITAKDVLLHGVSVLKHAI